MTQATTWGVPRVADAPVTPTDMAIRMDESLDAVLASHSGATRPDYAVAGTVWRDTDTGQLFMFDGTTDLQIALKTAVPASASATGDPGDVSWDADYLYICTATDTWKRVAVATW